MNKVLFWDFHGTLSYPDSLWSRCVYETAKEKLPDIPFTFDDVRAHLDNDHFPWHHPENTYLHLTDPALWWRHIEKLFYNTYRSLGLSEEVADALSPWVRGRILNPRGYRLYEDAADTLELLHHRGWRHIIVSNNFPELELICNQIGIGKYFDDFVVSALVGYDKPRREIFEIALKRAGHPDCCYMIGDNPEADGMGAKNAGLSCILLHQSQSENADYCCETFADLLQLEILH